MSATQPLLAVRGVKTYYGKIIALKGVDVDVNPGEIVTMIGANGAGKSTLMMTIFGNPQAREGSITYDGRDITRMPSHEIARLGIAQSPEGRRIFPRMTVYENLQMGASVNNFAHFDEDLERMCTLFPRVKERLQQRGGTLSGGEQQMVAIARALMARPKLLMLDEPSLGLAPLIVKQIFEAIRELNRSEGLTVFLVEQNAFHALKLAHRVADETGGRAAQLRHQRGVGPRERGHLDQRHFLDHRCGLRAPWRERSLPDRCGPDDPGQRGPGNGAGPSPAVGPSGRRAIARPGGRAVGTATSPRPAPAYDPACADCNVSARPRPRSQPCPQPPATRPASSAAAST